MTILPSSTAQLHELQAIRDLRELAQFYERLLFSTGGALNLQKCLWFLISWTWKKGKATMATTINAPGELYLSSGLDAIAQKIPCIEPTHSYRTLGIHIAGSGKMKKAKTLLRNESVTYASAISQSHMSPDEAFFSFQLYFFRK
jgi:hypothetical protein